MYEFPKANARKRLPFYKGAFNNSLDKMRRGGEGRGSKMSVFVYAHTANVLTIKTMDFDHVPNPGIMSP